MANDTEKNGLTGGLDTQGTVAMMEKYAIALQALGLVNLGMRGIQDIETLAICISEESGEVSRATLDLRLHQEDGRAGALDKVREEAIDLGALCLQLMLCVGEELRLEDKERSPDASKLPERIPLSRGGTDVFSDGD
jgi:NTP pyrophosphatase (non-canonical NTP hydrolase)